MVSDIYSLVWIKDASVDWMSLDAVILGSKIVFCLTLLSVDESVEKLKSYGKGKIVANFDFI